ncbi:uncharacterized protein BXZ73DRAFT_15955, partial [Epithele typhae]|uniref:uncharacterized protein n=1 Tax=Epithele typhae TaxID=378194 RepID=UPI0020073754
KPSLDQINHALQPLVSDMLIFWRTGVFYSRTFNHRFGRLARCALVPVVCDLLAARQVSGFGSHNAKYFCSVCKLLHVDRNNIDFRNWTMRSLIEHRNDAQAWRDKTSNHQRQKAFKENSVRWSVLLELPYWDPIRYTVIDSMHNHYLGLLQSHVRDLWGMNAEADDVQGEETPLEPDEIRNAEAQLAQGSKTALGKALASWITLLGQLHEAMPKTLLPSWMNPVPANVGLKVRGKLSADQWHTFCVVNLPIVLIPLWHGQGGRERDMLDNFMDLVTAIVIGGLLEMSEHWAQLYEEATSRYLQKALELYHFDVTPNQHNALHIPFFFRLFGPLHSVRTFFSERKNFLLQRLNTNSRFG